MSWWTGSAVGFDCETDGRDPAEARMITGACVQLAGGKSVGQFEFMAKPERPIPDEAAAIHGISTERAETEGMPREAAVRAVVEQLAVAGPLCPVVGQNVSYDLTLLDREMRRTGVGHLALDADRMVSLIVDGDTLTDFPVIDTYVIDKAVDKYRKGKRQLSVLASHYWVPMAEGAAHGATADVVAALRIAWRMHQLGEMAIDYIACNGDDPAPHADHPFMKRYAGRRDPLELVGTFARLAELSLADLHAEQIVWAAEQARSLREYFATSGTGDPAGVDGSWPLRTLNTSSLVTVPGTTLI